MAETLRAYTQAPAYGSFSEDVLGTIEVGKYADLVVFEQNLFTIEPSDILHNEVVFTMVDGQVIFEKQAARTL